MRIRDAIKLIEADGWRLVNTKGSYRGYLGWLNTR